MNADCCTSGSTPCSALPGARDRYTVGCLRAAWKRNARLEVWLPLSVYQTEFGACGHGWWERARICGWGEGAIDMDS